MLLQPLNMVFDTKGLKHKVLNAKPGKHNFLNTIIREWRVLCIAPLNIGHKYRNFTT